MQTIDLPSYNVIIDYLNKQKRPRHLLFGNGFSMAYDPAIFSYNALSKFIENTSNDLLKKLFEVIKTKNFELIMQQLENFVEIAKVFGVNQKFIDSILEANKTLKMPRNV